MSERLPWGQSPYDGATPAEVVHDYVMVRGDLSAQYARDQLALWIERYAEQARRQGLTEARDDIRARRREFRRLDADEQYLLALDDAFGLVNNRTKV